MHTKGKDHNAPKTCQIKTFNVTMYNVIMTPNVGDNLSQTRLAEKENKQQAQRHEKFLNHI